MALRPSVIRDQDRIDARLTSEAEYRIAFTFIEALNEGTLFDRPAHAFLDAARERRLFHVLNRTTDNIIGTGIIQASGDEKSVETGSSIMNGQDKGQTVPRDTRFTRVWVKQQGCWQLVANHYSSQTTRQ